MAKSTQITEQHVIPLLTLIIGQINSQCWTLRCACFVRLFIVVYNLVEFSLHSRCVAALRFLRPLQYVVS